MFKTIANAFKVKDLRKKIIITLLLLLVFRIGCWIPALGFNVNSIAGIGNNGDGTFNFFSLMNMVNGGSLSNASVLALGVSPYITASIVIQLLTVAIPKLEQLAKSGEDGKRKINLYTRIAALVLAIAQAVGIVVGFGDTLDPNLTAIIPTWVVGIGVVLILVAGAMFTVWLGERITDLGIGNGVSMLIFVGILSSAMNAFGGAIQDAISNPTNWWVIALFVVAVILIFAFIVFIDGGERRVQVQYAKQIKGRKMYGGQNTYIPIKVNASGVMPIIFASALISLPQLIISFWPQSDAAKWYAEYMGAGSWVYIVISSLLILAFAFFYAQISFNADDVSKRIQQQGGFIPGIRAGKPTSEYLRKISNRITLFGAIFLALIALIPSLAFRAVGGGYGQLINAFSATGLMIVVSVALEIDKQLEAQMLIRNYKGFLD